MKKLFLKLIRFYQKSWFFRSLILRFLFFSNSNCKFIPSCSEYTYQAVSKYGIMRGSILGLKRIMRCHPLSKGGYDPVK